MLVDVPRFFTFVTILEWKCVIVALSPDTEFDFGSDDTDAPLPVTVASRISSLRANISQAWQCLVAKKACGLGFKEWAVQTGWVTGPDGFRLKQLFVQVLALILRARSTLNKLEML
ncbi:hypothetical protein L1987_53639 [Smallanthus sonchifolius]|uniref:Uncharacterized protein n=1 Tax=Smallanthus sonchifolius TaxID=185202 RepID=A0ACB9EWH0_9ASTR|nr:hypothetical protein L1987_53639 [Smallanthus sonchifolius]